MPDAEIRDDTNETKAGIYEALAVIKRSFERMISAMYTLEKKGVMPEDFAFNHELIASELWAKINCRILAAINERELDDRNHFTRMRANMEKKRK